MKRVISLIISILMILCLAACSSELKYYCADGATPANQNSMPRSGYIDMILINDDPSNNVDTPTDINSGYISNSDLCLVDELGSPHLFTSIDVINPTFIAKNDNSITLRCKYENLVPGTYTISCTSIDLYYDSTNHKESLIDFFKGRLGTQTMGKELNPINGTTITITDVGNKENDESDIEESDPEVELDLGYGPVTVKTSNNSVVFNDTKVFEVSIGDGDIFIPIDLSSTPVKLDGIFLNNEVYKYIDDSGKDIKIINRFAYAEVYTNKEVGNNPLSLHLSDVSEVPGTCATAIQKKAMETSKVYAQVNYSFVSNGKPVENDARIYVPVDGPAKVFYLFNAEKIGIVPCEVKDGYCEFNRYFDGSYVVCAK